MEKNIKTTKNKLYILTEGEFKHLFKLADGYKIPKSTLKQYSLYIQGCYLLYEYLIKIKDFKITFQGESELIKVVSDGDRGWIDFVAPLSTDFKLECSYYDKNRKEFNEFWTYTKFKNEDIMRVALTVYSELENILDKTSNKYRHKYNIELEYRNLLERYRSKNYLSHPIWIDGIKFMRELEVQNTSNKYEYLSHYDIERSINNRNGKISPEVLKIVNSLK